MTRHEVRDEITEFVRLELAADPAIELAPDVELLITGIVDSMGAVRLVGFVEDRWGVRVPPQDVTIENFGTIADITTYVTTHATGTGTDVGS